MAKVLIIEDDEGILLLSKRILGLSGHTVVAVTNAGAAFKAFAKSEFDLVITDLNMPGESGLDIVAKMREERPKQAIMIMSGGDMKSKEFLDEAQKLGPTYTLAKPFDLDDLSEAVKVSLKMAGA